MNCNKIKQNNLLKYQHYLFKLGSEISNASYYSERKKLLLIKMIVNFIVLVINKHT